MSAEQFYHEFKSCLSYLGLSWGDKYLVKVTCKDGVFAMEYGGRIVSFGTEE